MTDNKPKNLEHATRNGADVDFQLMSRALILAIEELVKNPHIRRQQDQ